MYLCEGVGALLRMRMQYHEDRDRDGLCEVPRRVADATAEDAVSPARSLHDDQPPSTFGPLERSEAER